MSPKVLADKLVNKTKNVSNISFFKKYFLKKEMLLTFLVLFTSLSANTFGDIFPVHLAH